MIKILMLLLLLLSVASANDEAMDINTGKVYEINKGVLENEVELYDYETNTYQYYEVNDTKEWDSYKELELYNTNDNSYKHIEVVK